MPLRFCGQDGLFKPRSGTTTDEFFINFTCLPVDTVVCYRLPPRRSACSNYPAGKEYSAMIRTMQETAPEIHHNAEKCDTDINRRTLLHHLRCDSQTSDQLPRLCRLAFCEFQRHPRTTLSSGKPSDKVKVSCVQQQDAPLRTKALVYRPALLVAVLPKQGQESIQGCSCILQ
jgi:hypothetical protein